MNNINPNIHYKFICSNKIKLEQWRHWRRRRRRLVVPRTKQPKKERTCTPICDLMSVESRSYFSVRLTECSCKAANSWDWVLDTDCELLTIKTLWAVCKFLIVVLETPYTRFLLGLLDDPVSIYKSGSTSGSKDHPHIFPLTGCYISPENKN